MFTVNNFFLCQTLIVRLVRASNVSVLFVIKFLKLVYNVCSENVDELKMQMQKIEVDLKKEV